MGFRNGVSKVKYETVVSQDMVGDRLKDRRQKEGLWELLKSGDGGRAWVTGSGGPRFKSRVCDSWRAASLFSKPQIPALYGGRQKALTCSAAVEFKGPFVYNVPHSICHNRYHYHIMQFSVAHHIFLPFACNTNTGNFLES